MHSSEIPCLQGLPLIANLADIRYRRLDFLLRLSREYGPISAFRVGSQTCLLINTPELVYEVLAVHAFDFEKPALIRSYLYPLLGNGLVLSENAFHRQQRKLIAPIFMRNRLSAYADIIGSYTERFHSRWAEDETLDIAHQMMRLTLWIIGQILFKADVLYEAEELDMALMRTQRHVSSLFGSLFPIPYTWPTPSNLRFRKDLTHLDAIIYRLLEQRHQSSKNDSDLLSILLKAQEEDGNYMSDSQVRDEAITLFLAGHENMSNALTWTWYLLLQHPHVYRRMRDEVDNNLGGRIATFADLPNLPYTLQVFKEAMRLYPPAYIIGRQAVRPVKIGKYQLPTGAIVLISAYTLHRRSDYFPDPERFDPERFAPEAEQCLPPHAYIPFGMGPRSCIGGHLAMIEGQIILATLAQRVLFQRMDRRDAEPEALISLRPKNGINVLVRHRPELHSILES